MQGRQVFTNAVKRMAGSAGALLERIGWPVDSVDRFVGHQANVRILHAVAEQLGVPVERAVINLDKVGNTSAASIPLALGDAAAAGDISSRRPGPDERLRRRCHLGLGGPGVARARSRVTAPTTPLSTPLDLDEGESRCHSCWPTTSYRS